MSKALTVADINLRKPVDSRLTAISIFEKENGNRFANCICQCGKETAVYIGKITTGHTKSCGCLSIEITQNNSTKYFPVNRKIYRCWYAMIERCYDEKNPRFHCYGGKGVTVCDEWKNSYQSFLTWAVSNGWEKGLQLDKDIKGNGLIYSPENCCFVTPKQNANKRTTCRYYQYKGNEFTLMQISKMVNVGYDILRGRLNRGLEIEAAINYS